MTGTQRKDRGTGLAGASSTKNKQNVAADIVRNKVELRGEKTKSELKKEGKGGGVSG